MCVPTFIPALCLALASVAFAQNEHRAAEENTDQQQTKSHTFSDYNFLGPLRLSPKIKSTTNQDGKPLLPENTEPELSSRQEGFAEKLQDPLKEKQESKRIFQKSENDYEVSETVPSQLVQRTTDDYGQFNTWSLPKRLSPNRVNYIYKKIKSFPILPFKVIRKDSPMHHISAYGAIEPSLSDLPQQDNIGRFYNKFVQSFQSDMSRPEFMANLENYPPNPIPKINSINYYQISRAPSNYLQVPQKEVERLPKPVETSAQYKASLMESLIAYLDEIIHEIPARVQYELKEFMHEINHTLGKGVRQLLKDGYSNDSVKRMKKKFAKAAKILSSMETYSEDKKTIDILFKKLKRTFNSLKAIQFKNRDSEPAIKLEENYGRKPNVNIFQTHIIPDDDYVYTSPYLQTPQSLPLIPQENSHNIYDQPRFRPVDVHSVPFNYNYLGSLPLNQIVQRYHFDKQFEHNNNPFPDITMFKYLPNREDPIKYNIPNNISLQKIKPVPLSQWEQLYTPPLLSLRGKIGDVYQPITTISENFEHLTKGKDGTIQGDVVPEYKKQSFPNNLLASLNGKTKESIFRLQSLKNYRGFNRNSHEFLNYQPNYVQYSPINDLHTRNALYNTKELRMQYTKNNEDFDELDKLGNDSKVRTDLNMRNTNIITRTNEEENTEADTKTTKDPDRALCPPGYIEYSKKGSDSCLAAGVPYTQRPPDKFLQELHNVIF